MSADEIRRLAESKVIANCCGKKRGANTPCSVCYENNDGTCEDKEAIRAVILDFAAMVERCETVIRDVRKKLPDEFACVVEGVMNYVMRGNAEKGDGKC